MKEKESGQFVIYSRKSKFTGKGESIGNQVELCKEYIRANYGDQTAENVVIYEDEGFSGGNLNRPDFKKMMKAAREKRFKAIVVYRLDRISRNISDFSALIEELSRLDIAFISIREQFDTSSPMGRAMMYIASVFSQLERETIAERIRDNMHELAKTGRWLGGTTPTGYTSESVKSVTVDGKSKKACKLKLIPEEAEIVKKIYDLYTETDSLTLTEAELLRQRVKTKTGRDFTRFSVKGILQNPVYLIADKDAYNYFLDREADVFSEQSDFDGIHGILAYNRTDQEKGKTTVYLPVQEWIVSVGQHPGIIPAKTWISVQESLERNRSKAYRKPRSNEALLTGLLYCRCGNRMYPKLSKRRTADGKPIYTYVCKMKERSQRSVCNLRNANGNTLDTAIIEQIKMLSEDRPGFITQLEQSKEFYTGNREEYETKLSDLRDERAENEKKITALVDSLAEFGDSTARGHVAKRVNELHRINEEITARITELEGLTSQHALSEIEFDLLRQLLAVFKNSMDDMSIEQKRAAVRTVVRKVIWDGQYAHVILFGASEEEIEYPDTRDLLSVPEDDDPDALEPFADVDYGPEDEERPSDDTKTRWGEDSKCYSIPSAFSGAKNTPSAYWEVFQGFLPNLFIMCRTDGGTTRFAPLYIHSFRLIAPRKLLEAQMFNRQYHSYADIDNVPDRLRWCRHQLGLMQAEVARIIGMSQSLYLHMENGVCEKNSFQIMEKLAALYQVPVTDLLDDYNRFLYDGQGWQIKALRESRGMTVAQFAKRLGVYASTVRKWEKDQARMTVSVRTTYVLPKRKKERKIVPRSLEKTQDFSGFLKKRRGMDESAGIKT